MWDTNLTGKKHAQVAGKTLFLGMSARVFMEDINIWTGRLSNEDLHHHCGWASSILSKAWIEQKREKKEEDNTLGSSWSHRFSEVVSSHLLQPLDCHLNHQLLWSFLRLSSGFLQFQVELQNTTGFPASPGRIEYGTSQPSKSISLSLYVCMYVHVCECVCIYIYIFFFFFSYRFCFS